MKRIEFQALSRMRADEGKCLLDAGLYAGSYYLTGYSVECGLKAVIAKNCERYQFPDKGFATACYTHDLRVLIKLAGLQSASSRQWILAARSGKTGRPSASGAKWPGTEPWFLRTRRNVYTSHALANLKEY